MIEDLFNQIIQMLTNLGNNLANTITRALSTTQAALENTFRNLVVSATTYIRDTIYGAFDSTVNIVMNGIRGIDTQLRSTYNHVSQGFSTLMQGLQTGIQYIGREIQQGLGSIANIAQVIKQIFEQLFGQFVKSLEQLGGFLSQALATIITMVTEMFEYMRRTIEELRQAIANFMRFDVNEFVTAYQSVIQAIARGGARS